MQLKEGLIAELQQSTASECVRRMQAGELTSEALTAACLARSEVVAETIRAWDALDPSYAMEQAKSRDFDKQAGRPLGRLHGLPLAVEAGIDSEDYAGSDGPAREDSFAVRSLRGAGAVLLGKADGTAFCLGPGGHSRNPYRPERETGGAGGASAALVSAGVVPGAIAARSDGAIALPASLCGVIGYRPTRGLMPRRGTALASSILGQIGVFARTVEDAALIGGSLAGYDPADDDSRLAPAPGLAEICASQPPVAPRFAFVRTPFWDSAEPATREAFAELLTALEQDIQVVELGEDYAAAPAEARRLLAADLAFAVEAGGRSAAAREGALMPLLEEGRALSSVSYRMSRQRSARFGDALAELFEDFDAVITPAAAGEAGPAEGTGSSSVFCDLWSLCGLPTVTLPLLSGEAGLPLGVQLVGAAFDQDVSVAFIDDGVFEIQKGQDTGEIGMKNFSPTYRALEMYDVEKLYVSKESLDERGLSEDDLVVDVEVLPDSQIADLMDEQDVIFTF